jgi:hypothetical protein
MMRFSASNRSLFGYGQACCELVLEAQEIEEVQRS